MTRLVYEDHIGLWEDELKDWVPDTVFDAHVHVGSAEIISEISESRRKDPLTTFTHLTWDELISVYQELYSGKTIEGIITFGFPIYEADITAGNRYIVRMMKIDSRVHGFIVSNPLNTRQTVAEFYEALESGVRFSGVKPYFDLLRKSNYEVSMPEFIPDDLLRFMDQEKLIMMLHTSGVGMSDVENQHFVRSMAENYPSIKVVLAHMGRYLEPKQFRDFMKSDVLSYPSVYLEMSSGTTSEVYEQVVAREDLRKRLLFGSDIPYGLICGIECWSEQTGPTFVTRCDYEWSDPAQPHTAAERNSLTYNTYHTIKALKDALDRLAISAGDAEQIKMDVFYLNARRLLGHTSGSKIERAEELSGV